MTGSIENGLGWHAHEAAHTRRQTRSPLPHYEKMVSMRRPRKRPSRRPPQSPHAMRSRGHSSIWHLLLLQCGIILSSEFVRIDGAQPVTTPSAPNGHPLDINSRRRPPSNAPPQARPRTRKQSEHSYTNLQFQRSSGASLSYLAFTPSDDASIFQSRPFEAASDRSNGPWLIFQGGDHTDLESDTANNVVSPGGNARIESLVLFDLSFMDHKTGNDVSSAELHLCKSESEGMGGPFEPDGVTIKSTPSKRSDSNGGNTDWKGDWKEKMVSWNNAPDPLEDAKATASFMHSNLDQDCRWDVYDVTYMIRLSLHTAHESLSVRIGSSYDYAGMYTSKEFKGGKFAPKLEVYTGDKKDEEEEKIAVPSLSDDNLITSSVTNGPGTGSGAIVTNIGTIGSDGVIFGCDYLGELIDFYIQGTPYKEGMRASNNGRVYECKGHPFTGWCATYKPGTSSASWEDAWSDVGECVTRIFRESQYDDAVQAATPSTPKPQLAVGDGCAIDPYDPKNGSYQAFDQVSYESRVFECKPAPAGAWCNMASYQPGSGAYSDMAWTKLNIIVGACNEDSILSNSGEISSDETSNMTSSNGNINSVGSSETLNNTESSDNNVTQSTMLGDQCEALFDDGHTYLLHDKVSSENYNYQCLVPAWCNDLLYAPHSENIYSSVAWRRIEEPCVGEPGTRQPTPRPTHAPTSSQPCTSNCCAPLFTAGYNYSQFERISFQQNNYICHVPEKCRQVQFAPRQGVDLVAVAWWKDVTPCQGVATGMPTPLPTPQPTTSEPTMYVATAESLAHDAYYNNSVPDRIALALNQAKREIEKNVLVRQTVDFEWKASEMYNFAGLLKALGVMTQHPLSTGPFYLAGGSDEGAKYGLTNVAAFLAQSMVENIKYDTCDESSTDFVNNKFPVSNACGQGGASYQDMKCSEDERQYECPVKLDMTIQAITNTKWAGGVEGAPGPLYCEPATREQPFTGFWDHLYKCDRPFRGEKCEAYDGHKLGRYDNSVAAANRAARTDVSGCCWWGRGVIATKGVCAIGKMNHFLGRGAAEVGREAPYGDVDLCEDPEQICSSSEYKELKWVAGMYTWIEKVQSYNEDGWSYLSELNRFADSGWEDGDSFIDQVSGILNRGCHDEESCGKADGTWERRTNFFKILNIFGLTPEAGEQVVSSHLRTKRPTFEPTKAPGMITTSSPSKRPSRTPTGSTNSINSNKQPTAQTIQSMPQPMAQTHSLTFQPTPSPSERPSRTPIISTSPTKQPTPQTMEQTVLQTMAQTHSLTVQPSLSPTKRPSRTPIRSANPTKQPTSQTKAQTMSQTQPITVWPSRRPTRAPHTRRPSSHPTQRPSQPEQPLQLVPSTPRPSRRPTRAPRTSRPTKEPSLSTSGNKRPSAEKWFGVSVKKKTYNGS